MTAPVGYSSDGTHGTLKSVGQRSVHYANSGARRIISIGFADVEHHADGRLKSVGGKPVQYNLNGEITRIGLDSVTYENGQIKSIGFKQVSYK